MGKRRSGFLKFLVLVVVLAVMHRLWMPLPAKLLLIKDDVHKADAIAILSGDWQFEREKRAIELYKEGYANKIIRILEAENISFDTVKQLLNSNIAQEEAYLNFFESRGVSSNDIILGEAVATSTFDELKAAEGIIANRQFHSIILVTSDYHMRRALMTAKWIFRSSGVKLYPVTAHSKDFNPNQWWLHEISIKEVILEYFNSAFYLLYHFLLGK